MFRTSLIKAHSAFKNVVNINSKSIVAARFMSKHSTETEEQFDNR